MYTLSLSIPDVARQADSANDDTINDPLAILINAEEELEFDTEFWGQYLIRRSQDGTL